MSFELTDFCWRVAESLLHKLVCLHMLPLVYRFSLQTRRGGLVKIYDSALMSGVSKSLFLCKHTLYLNVKLLTLKTLKAILQNSIFMKKYLYK